MDEMMTELAFEEDFSRPDEEDEQEKAPKEQAPDSLLGTMKNED